MVGLSDRGAGARFDPICRRASHYLPMNSTLRALLAALLALPGGSDSSEAAVAQDPSARAESMAEADATGWACTIETLLDDGFCAFEAEPSEAANALKQAAENLARVRDLAARACARVVKLDGEGAPDKVLSQLCAKDLRAAAYPCANDGRHPLLDAEGRFPESAQDCYRDMAEVLRRTRLMASISGPCCRCLAEAGCGGAAEHCNRALTSPTPRLPSCAPPRCEAACSYFVEPPSDLELETRTPPRPAGVKPVAI